VNAFPSANGDAAVCGKTAMTRFRLALTVSVLSSLEGTVHRIDVTHAILNALADVHPQGLAADTLAGLVNCEREALQRPLRLLKDTGAVQCSVEPREVSITDAAMSMLRGERSRY
jgi:hypothetical protein